MAKKKGSKKKQPEEKGQTRASVSSYQQGVEAEKGKMDAYAKSMQVDVKSMQNDFKKHAKEIKQAATALLEAGTKEMNEKVGGFRKEIRAQINENKEAAAYMGGSVEALTKAADQKKNDFRQWVKGDFQKWVRDFWG